MINHTIKNKENKSNMQKFIEVTALAGDKQDNLISRKRLINIDNIINVQNYYIDSKNKKLDIVDKSARSVIVGIFNNLFVLETYDEIKELIENASK